MHVIAQIGAWLLIPIAAIALVFGIHAVTSGGTAPATVATSTQSSSTTPAGTASSTSTLELDSAVPASGSPGDTIILRGSGFTASNKVLLNGALAASGVHLSSFTNGHQEITFTLPSSLTADCKDGQACPMYAILLTSGFYQLSVENENGTSASIPFEVISTMVVPAP